MDIAWALEAAARWVAQEASEIDPGDTAWLLASAALVMIMTPGLGFFYGGLVRQKNVIATIMQSFAVLCLISVQWVLWGYSLAFGPDLGGWGIIGNPFAWFGLNGVSHVEPNPAYAATVPHQAYMVFRAMFAIITPALITGAFAERAKFGPFLLFILLWATFVYDPVAHWVWSGHEGTLGWLRRLGALDFAGGTVVHINSGVAALAAALVFGKRIGYGRTFMEPNNIPLVVLGAALLWFGWFGFNAGSAVAAGSLATSAFVVTNTATGMAALAWMAMGWWLQRVPSLSGMAAGAVAGLVAITPASGYVNVWGALLIGLGAGVFCYLAAHVRARMPVDDSLDVWAVHGVGGTWGALATGLFTTTAINPGGADGLFFGNPGQMVPQLIAVVATWAYSFVVTFVLLKVLDVVFGLRVEPRAELLGLDLAQHGEPAYSLR